MAVLQSVNALCFLIFSVANPELFNLGYSRGIQQMCLNIFRPSGNFHSKMVDGCVVNCNADMNTLEEIRSRVLQSRNGPL